MTQEGKFELRKTTKKSTSKGLSYTGQEAGDRRLESRDGRQAGDRRQTGRRPAGDGNRQETDGRRETGGRLTGD